MANLTFDFLHHYQRGERRESDPANAYQYDEGHLIEAVLPETVTSVELHYWTRGMEEAEAYTPSSITANDDGSCTVLGNIPNKFFETDGDLRVYIVVNDAEASITTYEGKIHVVHRAMPDDYVDEDPDNPATRILTEARAAAATATAAAQTAQNVADSIPSDYSQMSEDVTQLKEDYSDILNSVYVTDTASGSIASFPDGADNVPVKSLTVDAESGHTQAVVTRTGKNLFDKSNTANILNNAYISGAKIDDGSQRCVVFIPCKPNKTYTASRKAVLTGERFAMGYTAELPAVGVAVKNVTQAPNAQTIGNPMSLSVTTGSDAKYVVVWAYWDNKTEALDDLQIELGTTATDYEPYQGQTVTIDLNGSLTETNITTIKGQNNIWSDAGDVEVEYRADTKLYIEKLTAPTEDDMIADHAISANSFFMVGNTLYRATTAIASGATITVGTNATKLSLSEALNALS